MTTTPTPLPPSRVPWLRLEPGQWANLRVVQTALVASVYANKRMHIDPSTYGRASPLDAIRHDIARDHGVLAGLAMMHDMHLHHRVVGTAWVYGHSAQDFEPRAMLFGFSRRTGETLLTMIKTLPFAVVQVERFGDKGETEYHFTVQRVATADRVRDVGDQDAQARALDLDQQTKPLPSYESDIRTQAANANWYR